MNICHVITRLIVGGAQENTILTCRGLVERGHRVTLMAGSQTGPEGSLWKDALATGCEVIRTDSLRRAVHPLHDWRAWGELRRQFRRIGPDIVHTHSSKAGIVGRAAAASVGVPVVLHTIHGMSFNRTQSLAARMLYRQLERWSAGHTTAFVTVADAMIDQAVAAALAPRSRFTTIRSGIETGLFTPDRRLRRRHRHEWGVADEEIVVGTIARLFENKGYEQIMAAMAPALLREPKLRFVWIGDGANRSSYERSLEALGLRDRVHLVGLLHPRQVISHINGFDIMLHASRWEGLPRGLVQGMLMEVPAISFDNDGAPEVVLPDETGLLVRYGDAGRLADAMVQLAGDPARRRTLGRCGRARCLELFDWRRMVAEIEALYEKMLARAAAPGCSQPQ